MSPTCITSDTSGSLLMAAMNAGVASVSDVSVGVVPYGASPYMAMVDATLEPAPGMLQVIWTLLASAQLGAGSPSEALTVRATLPGTVRVKVGLAIATSSKEPELAAQRYTSALGAASLSCALTERVTE